MGQVVKARDESGLVAGYLLRLLRESIPRTQIGFAEDVSVDLGTVQGWESGRRPLANMRAANLLRLRHRLALLGADRELLALLHAAMDADRVLTAALHTPATGHPLAEWVQSRDTAHMVAWAVRGIPPPALAHRPAPSRRGPAPPGPALTAAERADFFTHLRRTAETAHEAGDRSLLLRRQALYLASYDPAPDAGEWAEQALRTMRPALAVHGYSPRWIEARTTATVAARQGDPEQLYDFIDTALVDDEHGELANLAYWAYWTGAMPADQCDDGFMHVPSPAAWNPLHLYEHLVDSLHDTPGTVDLYLHSLTILLGSTPWLAQASPDATGRFADRATELLDGHLISRRSRQDLQCVQYRLRQTN